MPMEFTWYIPERILHVEVYGDNGIAELQQFGDTARQLVQEGKAPVHILLDDADAAPPPVSINVLKDALNMPSIDVQSFGWVVGVGEGDMVVKVIFPMLTKIMGIKYTRVATLDDAVDFLQYRDPTLPRF